MRTLRNGQVQLVYRGKTLKWRTLPAGTVRKQTPAKQVRKVKSKTVVKSPAAHHPWRRLGVAAGRRFWNGKKAQGQAAQLEMRDSGRPALRFGLPVSRISSRETEGPTATNQGDILS